jgi:hypothetical protein
MDLLTPVLIGIGLSMDCFAVSLAIGSTTKSRLIRADPPESLIRAIFPDSDTGFGVVKQCIGTWSEPELKRVKKEKSASGKTKVLFTPSPLSSSRHGAPRGRRPGSRSQSRQ